MLQVAEEATVDHLLLQRPVETLGYTIGLRLGDKDEASARKTRNQLIWCGF